MLGEGENCTGSDEKAPPPLAGEGRGQVVRGLLADASAEPA
jgi:3-oxoacyl-(acyl-carrier-protein) synthase